MMNYWWGNQGMMDLGGFGFFGFLVSLFWIVILVDLILLGLFLWKQVKKK